MRPIMLLPLMLAGCFSTAEPITVTEYVVRDIPTVPRPRPIELNDLDFDVVTSDSIEQYLQTLGDDYVFVSLTIPEYENLALNIDELRRYIEQQQAIIVYYEGAVNGE